MALIAAVALSTSGDIAALWTQDWFYVRLQKHTSCVVDDMYVNTLCSEMIMLLSVMLRYNFFRWPVRDSQVTHVRCNRWCSSCPASEGPVTQCLFLAVFLSILLSQAIKWHETVTCA